MTPPSPRHHASSDLGIESTQWDSGVADRQTFAGFGGDVSLDRAKLGSMHVVVVGAGAFGGWTAWHLLRAGARVTLIDAWGPGNARASSGGETRVIRGVYGGDRVYIEWTAKALKMWQELQSEWGEALYQRTGVLWMVGREDRYVRAALPFLSEFGLPFEELGPADAARRFPQVDFDDVDWVLLEQEGGYLNAAHACRVVRDRFVRAGGTYVHGAVDPCEAHPADGRLSKVKLSDGSAVSADRFVFACGPWLGRLFPDVMGDKILPSRQEVFYFGTPAGDERFHDTNFPAWVDFRESIYYGIPATASRGFKVADDTRGEGIDPTVADRAPTPARIEGAQNFLRHRFPALGDAPLVEARVCQYANSPDGHFIIDKHPVREDTWLVSGGSGHGFKLGPALGEFVARLVAEDRPAHPFFSLERFA